MPARFDRDDLDVLAASCDAAPVLPVTLSGRCHPGGASTCRVAAPGCVEAACAECGRAFAWLEVDLAGEGGWSSHHPECNPGRTGEAVVLSYALGSGVVRVSCAGCAGTLGELAMRRRGR
jgi:hypothetical protein